MIEWRDDVENAPRDGTTFLGLFEHNVGGAIYPSTARCRVDHRYRYLWWVVDASFDSPIVETHDNVEYCFILIKWAEIDIPQKEADYD